VDLQTYTDVSKRHTAPTFRAENWGSVFFQNVCIYLQNHRILRPRRPTSTSWTWEPQISYHTFLAKESDANEITMLSVCPSECVFATNNFWTNLFAFITALLNYVRKVGRIVLSRTFCSSMSFIFLRWQGQRGGLIPLQGSIYNSQQKVQLSH
jgi:hypothetical protein